jgi:hypothetical protein
MLLIDGKLRYRVKGKSLSQRLLKKLLTIAPKGKVEVMTEKEYMVKRFSELSPQQLATLLDLDTVTMVEVFYPELMELYHAGKLRMVFKDKPINTKGCADYDCI